MSRRGPLITLASVVVLAMIFLWANTQVGQAGQHGRTGRVGRDRRGVGPATRPRPRCMLCTPAGAAATR